MSTESLGTCTDCGQEYRDPNDVVPPSEPRDDLELKPVSWAEYAAQTHQDFECPVQKERELVAGIEAVLRYFGGGDFLAKVSEIINANEHDSEIIWGNGERWLKRERERGREQERVGGIGTPRGGTDTRPRGLSLVEPIQEGQSDGRFTDTGAGSPLPEVPHPGRDDA